MRTRRKKRPSSFCLLISSLAMFVRALTAAFARRSRTRCNPPRWRTGRPRRHPIRRSPGEQATRRPCKVGHRKTVFEVEQQENSGLLRIGAVKTSSDSVRSDELLWMLTNFHIKSPRLVRHGTAVVRLVCDASTFNLKWQSKVSTAPVQPFLIHPLCLRHHC